MSKPGFVLAAVILAGTTFAAQKAAADAEYTRLQQLPDSVTVRLSPPESSSVAVSVDPASVSSSPKLSVELSVAV